MRCRISADAKFRSYLEEGELEWFLSSALYSVHKIKLKICGLYISIFYEAFKALCKYVRVSFIFRNFLRSQKTGLQLSNWNPRERRCQPEYLTNYELKDFIRSFFTILLKKNYIIHMVMRIVL